MSTESIRLFILIIGWPIFIFGGAYIYYTAYNFYKDLGRTPIAKLIPVFAIGILVTMLSLGLVSTAYMINHLSDGVMYVMPVFFIWLMVISYVMRASSKMNKSAIEYNQELLELDRAKTDFLSMASHQLRTPLSGIKWTIDLIMLKKSTYDEELLRKIETIDNSAQKMMILISNLLNVVRIDTGKVVLNREDFDLSVLISEIVDSLKANSDKNKNHVKFIYNEELSYKLKQDKTLLGEAIKNIISNCINYGGSDTEILVNLSKEGSRYVITMNNRGPVIPEDKLEKIFERFSREKDKQNIQEIGGLGLYLSREFVSMLHGELYVKSNVKEGTTFYIKI